MDIKTTATFDTWLAGLRDRKAAAIITARIVRVAGGLLGDVKSVGGPVNELRIDYGPGYRVYFIKQGKTVIVLLCGGDKSTQQHDIKQAQKLALNP
ncbi:type II toxin-antitoxin system RelE/ParE family toxin [Dyella caseinilytica]|uniref:Type II toxin-antitoxin system RelE/ParE family toxin n=1 Tax=Dyella caseinilytica TaxID=1849581 RepID=A0ABX7GQH2_9GAMM|nr:type II toxin-antitoxin system RelE/ParE family toxin [Dyella caseinilytica]QRN52318.1 type II toxin-antitoxin system RelE/ParE family toxin [Dyella caseinilytica]